MKTWIKKLDQGHIGLGSSAHSGGPGDIVAGLCKNHTQPWGKVIIICFHFIN